jgi:hypothetical protein
MVDVTAAVNKVTNLKDSKVIPKDGVWRYVVIGVIGFLVVLALLFIGFVIKSLLYVAIFLVIMVVAVIVGVGVSQHKKS